VSRPGRDLPPRKGPPVPIVQEAGFTPEPVWTQRLEEKSFRLCRGSNIVRPVVQPVARHYKDRLLIQIQNKFCFLQSLCLKLGDTPFSWSPPLPSSFVGHVVLGCDAVWTRT
jgi:hypothetical protein